VNYPFIRELFTASSLDGVLAYTFLSQTANSSICRLSISQETG